MLYKKKVEKKNFWKVAVEQATHKAINQEIKSSRNYDIGTFRMGFPKSFYQKIKQNFCLYKKKKKNFKNQNRKKKKANGVPAANHKKNKKQF